MTPAHVVAAVEWAMLAMTVLGVLYVDYVATHRDVKADEDES